VEALRNHYNINVFAKHGESNESYYQNIQNVLESKPHFVLDDGCDLVNYLYTKRPDLIDNIIGGTEETTTGVQRLKAMEKDGMLKYPIIAVNDALTKHMFDNQYGTGQSTLDGIIRATNTLLAGKVFVIAGYGWCGKGLAQKAKGMGCRVIVTEVDSIKALQAHMDGFEVMPMIKACKNADYIVTVTGNKNVISLYNFVEMKDGVIIANSGHFDVEIDLNTLKQISSNVVEIRDNLEEYTLSNENSLNMQWIPDGKKILVLAQGRLVNLACAEGHPASVMDMSFANQALAAEFLSNTTLENKIYSVPQKIDELVAQYKLQSLNLKIDRLSLEQRNYINSWQEGT
jgi:adenosylhomocysteinase